VRPRTAAGLVLDQGPLTTPEVRVGWRGPRTMNVLHHLFGRSVHLRHHRHLTGTDAYTTGLRIEPGCQEALGTVVAGRTAAGAHYEGTAFLVTSSTPATASTLPIPYAGPRSAWLRGG
jgi:hypothetical protein